MELTDFDFVFGRRGADGHKWADTSLKFSDPATGHAVIVKVATAIKANPGDTHLDTFEAARPRSLEGLQAALRALAASSLEEIERSTE